MRVYPFSVLLIAILLILLVRDFERGLNRYFKHVFFIYAAVVMFSNVGNFIEIGTFTMTNRAFLSAFSFLIAAFIVVFNKKYDRKILFAGGALCICVFLGYLNLMLKPYTGGVANALPLWDALVYGMGDLDHHPGFSFDIETIFKVVHFPIVLSVAAKVFADQSTKKTFLGRLLRISDFVLAYSVIELIAIKGFGFSISRYIVIPFFGESEATFVYTDRLQGLFKEASHYAGALFIWGFLNIFQLHIAQKNGGKTAACRLRLLLIEVLLIVSTSFVGLMYAALMIIAYVFYCTKWNKMLFTFVLLLVCVVGVGIVTNETLMTSFGLSRVHQRIEKTLETFQRLANGEFGVASSEGARFTSMFYMIKSLAARPFFGVGAGITDAHSTLLATLANLGLCGTVAVGYMYLRFGKISSHRFSFYCIIILYLTFAGSFGGIFDFQYPMLFFFAGYAFGSVKVKEAEPVQPSAAVPVKNPDMQPV